jgi:hypothetical protein
VDGHRSAPLFSARKLRDGVIVCGQLSCDLGHGLPSRSEGIQDGVSAAGGGTDCRSALNTTGAITAASPRRRRAILDQGLGLAASRIRPHDEPRRVTVRKFTRRDPTSSAKPKCGEQKGPGVALQSASHQGQAPACGRRSIRPQIKPRLCEGRECPIAIPSAARRSKATPSSCSHRATTLRSPVRWMSSKTTAKSSARACLKYGMAG